jgi:hypothetical protein
VNGKQDNLLRATQPCNVNRCHTYPGTIGACAGAINRPAQLYKCLTRHQAVAFSLYLERQDTHQQEDAVLAEAGGTLCRVVQLCQELETCNTLASLCTLHGFITCHGHESRCRVYKLWVKCGLEGHGLHNGKEHAHKGQHAIVRFARRSWQ